MVTHEDSRPREAHAGDLDLLIERVGSWYTDLQAAKDRVREVMSHPATELFLREPATAMKGVGVRFDLNEDRKTQPPLTPEASDLPFALQMATTQQAVCDYLARRNGGVVDLLEATPIILERGLTTTENVRGIRKNLGTRLVRTGRWEKIGVWKYRLLAWPSSGFSTPVYDCAGTGEVDTTADGLLGTVDGPAEDSEHPGEQQNPN